MSGLRRQTQIYLEGVSGRRPPVPIDERRLEQAAQQRMRADAFAYVAAGAGNERTVLANRAAFDQWRIVPRMLRDVGQRDTSVELLGRRLPSPLLLGPIGVLELAHRQADVGVARGATGTPLVLSNQALQPMEAVAQTLGPSPRWFQLYWSKSDELVQSWWPARSVAAARRSWSRWTRRCWAGAPATWSAPTCRSCAARGSPSTPAIRCSPA